MNARTTFPPIRGVQLAAADRQLAFRRLIALFERDEVEAAVDALIAHLDARDGDVDLETTGIEDDFMQHALAEGAGCVISDPDCGVEDVNGPMALGDRSFAEWHTLPPPRRRAGHVDGRRRDGLDQPLDEDVEDDDPAEDDDPSEDGDSDRCAAGDDHMIAGPISQPASYQRYPPFADARVGDDDDAEPRYVQVSMDRPMAGNAS